MKSNTNEEALGMLGTPYDVPAEVRKAYDDYNSGRLMRDKFIEKLEQLMWRSKTNAPQYFAGLKKVTDWLKQKGSSQEQGGIKLKDEGYGAVYTKDIKKDPKHTTNKTTGKVNRWTVKFDENMMAAGAQTPPTEKMISHLIYSLKPDVAVVFYSLTNPELKIYVRRTHSKSFEVIDSGGGEYILRIPQDKEKLKILISQLAMKHRRYNQFQTFKTISSQPEYSSTMKTSELKEMIKEIVSEMWVGFDERKKTYEAAVPHPTIIPKYTKSVLEIINGLEIGEILWLSSDKKGSHQESVEKVEDSGNLSFKVKRGNKTEAYSDNDIRYYANSVAVHPNFNYYSIQDIGGFREEEQPVKEFDKLHTNPRELYEATGNTQKDKLKNIVREAINEVEFDRDYDGETERQLVNSIASIARTAVLNKTLHPQIMQKYLKEIDRLASLLVDIHKTSGR